MFYQVGNQLKPTDKRVKGMKSYYQQLPNLCFLATFYEKYKDIFWLGNQRPFEGPSEPLPSQEQEQKQDQEQEKISSLQEDDVSAADNHLNCPHEEIIKLYHEILSMCPPVRVWSKTRQVHLRQRWKENPKHQTLAWWKNILNM